VLRLDLVQYNMASRLGSQTAPPTPSALSTLISTKTSQISSSAPALAKVLALPTEILHNLQYQHTWADLRLHQITSGGKLADIPSDTPSKSQEPISIVLSGQPPRHVYVHPDLQSLLIEHSLSASTAIAPQREYVIPLSISQKDVGIETLAGIFDALPARARIAVAKEKDTWQDPKRVLLAMKAPDGLGGDGTVAYYVCQEGEQKPRQNG
jgi:tRNA-splicing endonuclease subunit Sen15, fungi type